MDPQMIDTVYVVAEGGERMRTPSPPFEIIYALTIDGADYAALHMEDHLGDLEPLVKLCVLCGGSVTVQMSGHIRASITRARVAGNWSALTGAVEDCVDYDHSKSHNVFFFDDDDLDNISQVQDMDFTPASSDFDDAASFDAAIARVPQAIAEIRAGKKVAVLSSDDEEDEGETDDGEEADVESDAKSARLV
jgi:hypothetical protein